MTILHPTPAPVKSAPSSRRVAALGWPAWTDSHRWVPSEDGPSEADREWLATQHDDSEGLTDAELVEDLDAPEPDWDAMAEESAALDRLCAGCLL